MNLRKKRIAIRERPKLPLWPYRELTLGLQRWEDTSKHLESVSVVARMETLRDDAPKASRGHPHGLAPLASEITGRVTSPGMQVSGVRNSDPRSRLTGPRASHFGPCPQHHTGAPGDSNWRRPSC